MLIKILNTNIKISLSRDNFIILMYNFPCFYLCGLFSYKSELILLGICFLSVNNTGYYFKSLKILQQYLEYLHSIFFLHKHTKIYLTNPFLLKRFRLL